MGPPNRSQTYPSSPDTARYSCGRLLHPNVRNRYVRPKNGNFVTSHSLTTCHNSYFIERRSKSTTSFSSQRQTARHPPNTLPQRTTLSKCKIPIESLPYSACARVLAPSIQFPKLIHILCQNGENGVRFDVCYTPNLPAPPAYLDVISRWDLAYPSITTPHGVLKPPPGSLCGETTCVCATFPNLPLR